MEHFNKLTPAEHERLSLLMEECGEAVHIIGKILRHGYESSHPDGGPTNRGLLEKELGHIRNAQKMMVDAKDISWANINIYQGRKQNKIGQYLHHQKANQSFVADAKGRAAQLTVNNTGGAVFCNPPKNTTSVKIGEVLPFMFKGKMTPFEIVRISGNSLSLRSCDLKWVNRCQVDFWLKQKGIIANQQNHATGNNPGA